MSQKTQLLFMVFFFTSLSNFLFADGNPICKEFFVNGEPAPCEGVEYTYEVNYNDNRLSTSGISWVVTGGIITAVDGIPVDYSKIPNNGYGEYPKAVTEYKNLDINEIGQGIDEGGQTLTEALYELFGGGLSTRLVKVTVRWGEFYYNPFTHQHELSPSIGNQTYTRTISAVGYNLGLLQLCGNKYDSKTVTVVPSANLGANFTNQTLPSCTNGQFNISVPYYDNCYYTWSVPQGWYIDGSGTQQNGWMTTNTIGSPWANQITGTANNWGSNGYINGGNIKVTITPRCGSAVSNTIVYQGMSVTASMTPEQLTMCPSGTATFTTNITGGNGTAPYTYNWKLYTGWGQVRNLGTLPNSSYTLPGSELVGDPTFVVVRVRDARGCFAEVSSTVHVNNGTNDWGAYDFFTNFITPQPAIAGTDIVHDAIGLPYYVGQDNKIYYYNYVTSPFIGWQNLSIPGTNATGPLVMYTSGNTKTIYYKDGETFGLSFVTLSSGATNWSSSNSVPNTSVAGSLKVDNAGNVFFRSDDNKIYSSINNFASPIVTVQSNSEFDVTGSLIYYINTQGRIDAVYYNGNPYALSWNPTALPGTNVKTDDNNNAYFVSGNNIIYKVTGNNPETTRSDFYSNGTFSVNKATGVIYAAGTDKNIYQVFYKNSSWQPALKISYWLARPNSPINTVNGFAQAGAIDFRSPNTFYVGEDGLVKLILYNTTAYCQPAQLKMASTTHYGEDYLPNGTTTDFSRMDVMNVFPNPFSQSASVSLKVENEGLVHLTVLNSMGEKVSSVVNGKVLSSGEYQFTITESKLHEGIYFLQYSLNGSVVDTKKMIVQ